MNPSYPLAVALKSLFSIPGDLMIPLTISCVTGNALDNNFAHISGTKCNGLTTLEYLPFLGLRRSLAVNLQEEMRSQVFLQH